MIKIRYRNANELPPGLHATAERHGRTPISLGLSYGQQHDVELTYAAQQCARFGIERRVIDVRLGFAAGFGFVIAAALFAGDLTLRQYAGHSLFPMAAPTGGTLLILSWLLLAAAAVWPRRGV